MTDAEVKLLAALKGIPPMSRAQAKAKLRTLAMEIPVPSRRHASGELERHRKERHQADFNALIEAIDAIPDTSCTGCDGDK